MISFPSWIFGYLYPEPDKPRNGYEVIYDNIRCWSARENIMISENATLSDYAVKMERPLLLLFVYTLPLILTFRDDESDRSLVNRICRLAMKLFWRFSLLLYLLRALIKFPDYYNDCAAIITILILPDIVYTYIILVTRAVCDYSLLSISWYNERRTTSRSVQRPAVSVSDTVIGQIQADHESGERDINSVRASRSIDSIKADDISVNISTFICGQDDSVVQDDLMLTNIDHVSSGDMADLHTVKNDTGKELKLNPDEVIIDMTDPVPVEHSTRRMNRKSLAKSLLPRIKTYKVPLALTGLTLWAPRHAKMAAHCYVLYRVIEPALDNFSSAPMTFSQRITSSTRKSRSVLTRRNITYDSTDIRMSLLGVRNTPDNARMTAIKALGELCNLYSEYNAVTNFQSKRLY